MKILFDHQIFELQRFGGISRYFLELITNLDKDSSIEWDLPIVYSSNEYLKSSAFFSKGLLPKVQTSEDYQDFFWGMKFKGKQFLFEKKSKFLPGQSAVQSEENKSKTIRKLKEGNYDVFHPTFYDDYFLDHIGTRPFVLTVHDLINQVFPEFNLYDTVDKSKLLFDKAHKIIAVSENTKADIVNLFNVEAEKISVIHLASSLNSSSSNVSQAFTNKIPHQFLLFVGNREGYKNFLFFVQIISALKVKGTELNVVCTGPPFNKNELYLINKLGVGENFFYTYTNDDELAYLYRNALAFVFPTMYEGFGIPVLEAFNCGCPVLASNTSSLPEICENAAIYFEPKDPASMIKAIKSLTTDNALRQEKISSGFDQVKKFSWQLTALKTAQVYREIVKGNG